MTELHGKKEHPEPSYDELAKYLLCPRIAYRLGVTLPAAKRHRKVAARFGVARSTLYRTVVLKSCLP